jgi:hypothetical protein
MMSIWQPLIITGALAALATLIGVALYTRSRSHIEYKWARFSGAAAIAVAAFFGMTRFYLELSDRGQIQTQLGLDRYRTARGHYDLCLEQEKSFACRDPANDLRNACAALLEPTKTSP